MVGITMSGLSTTWVILLLLWTLPWKGYALWLAARTDSPWWFIALLIVNTAAILDIIYIFAVGRPHLKKQEAESSSASAEK